jgi:hypothetical protein
VTTYVFYFALVITHDVEESFFSFILKTTKTIAVLVQIFGSRGAEYGYLTALLNSRDQKEKCYMFGR